jgi:hypothetical protein
MIYDGLMSVSESRALDAISAVNDLLGTGLIGVAAQVGHDRMSLNLLWNPNCAPEDQVLSDYRDDLDALGGAGEHYVFEARSVSIREWRSDVVQQCIPVFWSVNAAPQSWPRPALLPWSDSRPPGPPVVAELSVLSRLSVHVIEARLFSQTFSQEGLEALGVGVVGADTVLDFQGAFLSSRRRELENLLAAYRPKLRAIPGSGVWRIRWNSGEARPGPTWGPVLTTRARSR